MTTLVVPAAGEGSRLGGGGPKALVDLCGRPLIDWVVSAAMEYVDHLVVVIQPSQQPLFEEWVSGAKLPFGVDWALQEVAAGSLAAVSIGIERVREIGRLEAGVIVIWSDQVGVAADTVKRVTEPLATRSSVLAVPLCETSRPYVWIELDDSERIARVLRTRDGDASPELGLADLGTFGMSESLALDFLGLAKRTVPTESHRELDFTYALVELSTLADTTLLPRAASKSELLAINTPDDFAHACELLGGRDD